MSRRNAIYVIERLERSTELTIQRNAGPSGTHKYRINVKALQGEGANIAYGVQSFHVKNSDAKLHPNRQEPSLREKKEKDNTANAVFRSADKASAPPMASWPDADKAVYDFLLTQDILTYITPPLDYDWWAELSYIIPWPTLDWLQKEFAKMQQWLRENPRRKPTPKGTSRFLRTWLEKAYNQERRFKHV